MWPVGLLYNIWSIKGRGLLYLWSVRKGVTVSVASKGKGVPPDSKGKGVPPASKGKGFLPPVKRMGLLYGKSLLYMWSVK